MRGAWLAAALLVAALGGIAAPVQAGNPLPRTHIAAFDSVAAAVAAELVPAGAIPAGRSVEITAPLPGDTLSLFEQRVVQRLRAEGVTVRMAAAPAAPAIDPVTGEARAETGAAAVDGSLRLGLRVESRSVVFVRRIGRFPFGTKGYERLVTLQAQARLVDAASGDVLWAKTASRGATDVLPARDLDTAASGTGMFRPAVPRGTRFGFLEPLIVSGVVAGLVILFYSNRT
ncbi:MAG: hypothetical protein AABZ94_09835 [Candidatus Eisenbacteria bacterium]